jgi:hypothetical protein
MKARIYPKADATSQWWESKFDRGTFTEIEKILLHTTETIGWPGYVSGASAPTLTYNAKTRQWRQHNYINTSARALVDPAGTPVRENRDDVIQIEIIAYSDEKIGASVGGVLVSKLTDDNYRDLADFYAWVRKEWGGPPLVAAKFISYPASYGASTVRMSSDAYNAFRGLCGHMHASGNAHGDPSAINAAKIIQYVKEKETPVTPPATPPADQGTQAPTIENPDTRQIWGWDGIVAPAAQVAAGNKFWAPGSYLKWTFEQGTDTLELLRSVDKKLTEVLTLLKTPPTA